MRTVRGKWYSTDELMAMMRAIEDDPKNHLPPGGLWLYTKEARKKMDAIAMAITDNIIDRKKADGTFVPTSGYSGRQTNRRR